MSAEELKDLNVQEHEKDVKNTVADTDVNKVDTLIKEIDDAQKGKSTEILVPKKTDIPAKTLKAEKEKIKSEDEKNKETAIEKATISAFIKNSPDVISAITTNIINNFFNIERLRGQTKITTFIEAKQAFEDDLKKIQGSANYTALLAEDKTLEATVTSITDNLLVLQSQIDLKQIDNTPAYADKFSKSELKAFEKLAGENILAKKPPATDSDKEKNTALIKTLTGKTEVTEKEKSSLDTLLSKTPTLEIAKELFDTNKGAWDALIENKKLTFVDATKTEHLNTLITLYFQDSYPEDTVTKSEIKTYETTGEQYILVTGKANNLDIKFGKTTDALHQARADDYMYTRKRENAGEKPTIKFKSKDIYFTAESILNAAGAEKKIHEVIDMDKTPPTKIQITRLGSTIKVEASLQKDYTDTNITEKTTTYVTEDKKIIELKVGDKIEGINSNTSIRNSINDIDGKGSYREFEDAIDAEKTDAKKIVFLKKALAEGILAEIDTNTHGAIDVETKKNGYYSLIVENIVKLNDQDLLEAYLGNVIVDEKVNTKYLGTTREQQRLNFNKIVSKDNNWTISPENLVKLEELKGAIAQNTDPENFQEKLSNGLDSLIDTFGPLLFNVLKMFGYGKRSLLKMFPTYADKINGMFLEEYGLKPDAVKDAVIAISKDKYTTTEIDDPSSPPTAKEIQKAAFEEKDANITAYIDKLTAGEYYTYINVAVLQKGLNIYNKTSTKQVNINDLVTITTDSTTKKQSITAIEDKTTFTAVMTAILKNDKTRTNIAAANEEITTATTGKVTGRGDNEFFKNIDDSERYGIKNQQDIIRYLTASLFSNKDLSYVMTENELHNEAKVDNAETAAKGTEYLVTVADTEFRSTKDVTGTPSKLAKDTPVTSVMKGTKEVTSTGAKLKLTATTDADKIFKKVTRTVDGETETGRVLKDNIKATADIAAEKAKKLDLKDGFATEEKGVYTLTDKVTNKIQIQDIFTTLDATNGPKSLTLTPEAGGVDKTLIKGLNPDKSGKYTYLDGKVRAFIKPGDKLQAVVEATPVAAAETPEEKELGEKGEKISTAINKITSGVYEGFDTTTYAYTTTPTAGQTLYETDILNPIKEILEITNDVKQINGKYLSEYPEYDNFISEYSELSNKKNTKDELTIKKAMPHIKNMLIMMGGTDQTYKTITDNMIIGTTYEAGTGKHEIIMKNSLGTEIGTLKWKKTESGNTRTLTPDWVLPTVAAK